MSSVRYVGLIILFSRFHLAASRQLCVSDRRSHTNARCAAVGSMLSTSSTLIYGSVAKTKWRWRRSSGRYVGLVNAFSGFHVATSRKLCVSNRRSRTAAHSAADGSMSSANFLLISSSVAIVSCLNGSRRWSAARQVYLALGSATSCEFHCFKAKPHACWKCGKRFDAWHKLQQHGWAQHDEWAKR